MRLFIREFVGLYGDKLADLDAPSALTLPRRMKEVLGCLMEGDGEKQVAARLQISPHTVHNYVKQLHARFGAATRAELLAQCRPLWPVLKEFDSKDVRYSTGNFHK